MRNIQVYIRTLRDDDARSDRRCGVLNRVREPVVPGRSTNGGSANPGRTSFWTRFDVLIATNIIKNISGCEKTAVGGDGHSRIIIAHQLRITKKKKQLCYATRKTGARVNFFFSINNITTGEKKKKINNTKY